MTHPFVRRMACLIVVAAIFADLAACATETPREHFGHRRPDGDGGRIGGSRAQLFISPAGKPFRAAAGDPYPVGLWFAAADADHDGKLTRDELRQDAAAFFHEIDVNHDGVIDGEEVSRYEHVVAPEILGLIADRASGERGRAGGSGGGGGMGGGRRGGGWSGGGAASGSREARPQGAGLYGLINQPEPVTAADANFDGKITLAEFLGAADRHFAALDTAQAGFVPLSGLPQTSVQAMGGGHRHHPHHD